MNKNSKLGNYILNELIHKQKFEIWKATNNLDNKVVVLKIFNLNVYYELISSEMELLIYNLTKDSPYFNKLIYSYESNNDYLWLPMKPMLGSIDKLFNYDNIICESIVKEIGIMLIKALNFLHSNGYIYIDIKPTNILYDENLNFVLTDFDLVYKITEYSGSTGTIAFSTSNCLKGKSNCWDDLEAIIYTLAFMLELKLPWIQKWKKENIYPDNITPDIAIRDTKINDLLINTNYLFINKYCEYILNNSPNYNINNNNDNDKNNVDILHYNNLEKILKN